jgi:tetratricopeptide (TPR) repeat protein
MIAGRNIVIWVLGGLVALVLAAVVLWRMSGGPPLPALATYPNLPASFHRALQVARTSADARPRDPAALRQLARLYQANRLFAEARACYAVIAATGPGLQARDHYYLADLAQNENDLAGAQAELRAVLRAEPGYLPARVILAEALFKTGREAEAAQEYAEILQREAHQPQALLGLARIALQRGDEATAVSRLETLREFHPEFSSGAALLAQVLGRRGETERAAALQQISRQIHDPELVDPWQDALLADCYDSQRLAILAEQLLITGRATEASHFLTRLESLDPQSWIPAAVRGWSLAQAGQHPEAVREYHHALDQGGDADRICPLLEASLLALDRAPEAAVLLAEYHAKRPDSIPILRSYAEVAIWQGDEKLARVLLTKLVQAEPYLQAPNLNLARILWKAGERDEAARCLQRIVQGYPADIDARGMLAQYWLEKPDPPSAIKPLEQAIAQLPTTDPRRQPLTTMLGLAYRLTGNLAAARGDYAEAVRLADLAIGQRPEELPAYALKAQACLRLKKFPLAVDALEKMLTLAPGDPTVLLHLGDACYLAGEAGRAHAHWIDARQRVTADERDLAAALDLRLKNPGSVNLLP